MKKKTVLSRTLSALFLIFAFSITANAGVPVPQTIGDFVWEDLNGDGNQDIGEPGLAGIDVHLCGANSSMTIDCSVLDLFTTTDANGDYLFTNTDIFNSSYFDFTYTVEIILATVPAGFVATTPTSLFLDSGGSSNPISTADFGFQAIPVPAAAWLFGSGLLGLLGMARRKRAV